MKLTLDFTNKILEIEDSISYDELKKIVKKYDLKDWKIQPKINQSWYYPVTQPIVPYIQTQPYYNHEWTITSNA